MANRDIKITLSGVDKTGKAFGSLSKSLGNVGARLRTTGQSLSRTGTRMTLLGTGPALLLGKSMVSAFLKQKQAVAQMEAGLKRYEGRVNFTSKELRDMAAELQKVSTFGDEEILAGVTNQFLTFGGVIDTLTKQQFRDAQTQALNLATILGTDVKASALQLAKALDDPKQGLTALKRSGIQFTESQNELIRSLIDTGQKGKAASIILSSIDDNYKNIAKTQAENDPFGQMSRRLGDVKEQFGKVIFEAMQPMIIHLDKIVAGLGALDDGTRKTILSFGLAFAAAGPLLAISGMMLSNIGKLFIALSKFGKLFKIISLAFRGLSLVMLGKLALIVGAVIAAVLIIRHHWETLSNWLTSILESLGAKGETLGERWSNLFTRVFSNITNLFHDALESLRELWDSAWAVMSTVFNAFWQLIGPVVRPILGWLKTTWASIFTDLKDIFLDLKKIWQDVWPLLKILLVPILAQMGASFAIFVGVLTVGLALVTGAIKLLSLTFSALSGVISEVINFAKPIFNAFVDALIAGANLAIEAWNLVNGIWGGTDVNKIGTSGTPPSAPTPEQKAAFRPPVDEFGNRAIDRRLGFADGVGNFAGGLAMVGERGPELVNLPRGSDVIPNPATQDILGEGKDITININNQYDLDALVETVRLNLAEGIV